MAHRWSAIPVKWEACGRLEQMGAVIGPIDDSTDHIELRASDAGIQVVVECMNILEDATTLDLSESDISDASGPALGMLRTVTALHLARTGITDASIPHLARITTLQELSISGTCVSDAGLDGLARLKGLVFLQAIGTRITADGFFRLGALLPALSIES